MNYWLLALKEWNNRREGHKYLVPRRGTAEYQQVKALQEQIKKCVEEARYIEAP